MPSELGGFLEFIGGAGTERYLKITVGSLHHMNVMVALLGHELQHAAELADAPSVRSPREFVAFYRRIGLPSGTQRYDSAAARATGLKVQSELRRRTDVRVASHATTGDDGLLEGGSIAMP